MKLRKPHIEAHDNLERWLLTYADMITLLTAFFLMMYSMSVVSKGKFSQMATSVRSGFTGSAEGGQSILLGGGAHSATLGVSPDTQEAHYENAMSDLNKYVEQNKLDGKVSIRSDQRGVIITLLSDKMLFQRGKAELNRNSGKVLDKVANILKAAPNDIQIEGHTCNLPISNAQFPSNWELSTARAGVVLRYFTEHFGLPDKRFNASGYAATRPIFPNTTETRREKNRRVDIVLLKTEKQREGNLQRQAEIQRITNKSNVTPADSKAQDGSAATTNSTDTAKPDTGTAKDTTNTTTSPSQDSPNTSQSSGDGTAQVP